MSESFKHEVEFIDQGDRLSVAITSDVYTDQGVIRTYVSADLTDETLDKLAAFIGKREVPRMTLTKASHKLFMEYAEDAGNWSGTPLVGGNVGGSKEDAGNLTDLKKKGLLTTFDHDGDAWVEFTDAGKAYAAEHGVTIYD